MDLASALLVLSPEPQVIDREQSIFAGGYLPTHLPHAWTTASQRARWLVDREQAPLALRIRAALEAGLEERAWDLVAAQPDRGHNDPEVSGVLTWWAAGEAARLKLPRPEGGVILNGVDVTRRSFILRECRDGLRDAQQTFTRPRDEQQAMPGLPWPEWYGPVVIDLVPAAEAGAITLRPALPRITIDEATEQRRYRELIATEASRLQLEVFFDRTNIVPGWLFDGLPAVAAAKARGEGPSPRQMEEIRLAAGPERVRALLLGEDQDTKLAMAIVAKLVHVRHQHHLLDLLSALRSGADSLTALDIAYGFSIAELAR